MEEWLADHARVIRGYRYAHVTAVSRSWPRLRSQGENRIDLSFWTKNPNRDRLWAGRLRDAEILTPEQGQRAFNEYQRRGWIEEMLDEIDQVSGAWDVLDSTSWRWFFVFRFRPENLEWFGDLRPVPEDHRIWRVPRHSTLLSADGHGDAHRAGVRGHFDPVSENAYRVTSQRDSLVTPQHKKLQNRLLRSLQKQYGKSQVRREVFGVDILVFEKGKAHLIEIKIAPNARLAIREALGQILEYRFDTRVRRECGRRTVALHVVSSAPLDAETGLYLQSLNKNHDLDLRYHYYTLDSDSIHL